MKRFNLLAKDAIRKWQQHVEQVKRGQILDALRAQKLKEHLLKIPSRSIREGFSVICPGENRFIPVLRRVFEFFKERPKEALKNWRDYVVAVKEKAVLDNLRSLKLSLVLSALPNRTTRDSVHRIIGQGDLVRGSIRRIQLSLNKLPKEALALWSKFVQDVKDKKLLDRVRAHQLKNTMEKIPNRSIKDSVQRIIGQGDKIKGALKSMQNSLNKRPRDALQAWKQFVQDIKDQKILDHLKAQQLKEKLGLIPTRKLKDAVQRVIGQGDAVKGALRRF